MAISLKISGQDLWMAVFHAKQFDEFHFNVTLSGSYDKNTHG
jgi:hypothetical protein